MLARLTALLWGAPTVLLFLATGLYFSLKTGFYQCFGLKKWWTNTVGRLWAEREAGGLTPVSTLSTALAATLGTGSIAGVAAAIRLGGPGALFWMWISGLLAMMTGWAEKALSVAQRRRAGSGWQGGPVLWLRERGCPNLARLFALCTVLASLGMGNLVQVHSMAQAAGTAWGVPPLAAGLAAAGFTGLTLAGGLRRLSRVCAVVVPVMGLLYLAGSLWVILAHRDALPAALGQIIAGALGKRALLGGGAGTAIRVGLARGVATNEAGLGSTPLIHCQSANRDPAREGDWGILEVCCSTLVVCTVTGLALLTSGAGGQGADWTAAAFSTVLGPAGEGFVALCLALFGASSLLGWSWYGRCCLEELTGGDGLRGYHALFLLLAAGGGCWRLETVWQLSDCCNALMAWPSLLALWMWRREILACWRRENTPASDERGSDAGVSGQRVSPRV